MAERSDQQLPIHNTASNYSTCDGPKATTGTSHIATAFEECNGSAYSVNGQPVSLHEIQAALSGAAVDGKARIIIRPAEDALAEDIIRAVEQSRASKLGPVTMMR